MNEGQMHKRSNLVVLITRKLLAGSSVESLVALCVESREVRETAKGVAAAVPLEHAGL